MKGAFLSHEEAGLLNRNSVLRYVRKMGVVSRTDIWNNMNISRASVTQVIRQLQESDLIMETGEKKFSGKRKSRDLCLNANARFMYVFDWDSHYLCYMNLGGEVLEKRELAFPANCTPSVFAELVTAGVEELRATVSEQPERLLGLGICLPGLIDCRKGEVMYSTELGWRDVSIRELFADSFGEAVFLERTGNMIALGECEFGAGKKYQHVILILLDSEGIGMSSVVRGDCQHGNNYMFGELGHIKLPSRVICACGQRGCLEAIVRDRMMRNGGALDDEVMETIAYGVSTAATLVDPGITLLAGKLVRRMSAGQKDALIQRIRSMITNERFRDLTVDFCPEDPLMGAKGMNCYIFDRCFVS